MTGWARWLFLLIFGGVALVFIGIGAYLAHSQHDLITRSEKMTATITESYVGTEKRRSKNRDRYVSVPKITYTYVRGGKTYTSSQIFPLMSYRQDSGQDYSQQLVNQFAIGMEVPAWVVPGEKEATSYLIKEHAFGPYLFILFPMIHLSIGLLIWQGVNTRHAAVPTVGRGGFARLVGSTSVAAKRQTAMWMTALWWGVGAMACGHYFSVAEKPYPTMALVASGIYFGVGLIPLLLLLRYIMLAGSVGEAEVEVFPHPANRGGPLRVKVQQQIAGGTVQEMVVSLVCTKTERRNAGGKSSIVTSTEYEDKQSVPAAGLLGARSIKHELTLNLPADRPPTSTDPSGYPSYAWIIKIHTKRSGPDYHGAYKLQVT